MLEATKSMGSGKSVFSGQSLPVSALASIAALIEAGQVIAAAVILAACRSRIVIGVKDFLSSLLSIRADHYSHIDLLLIKS